MITNKDTTPQDYLNYAIDLAKDFVDVEVAMDLEINKSGTYADRVWESAYDLYCDEFKQKIFELVKSSGTLSDEIAGELNVSGCAEDLFTVVFNIKKGK